MRTKELCEIIKILIGSRQILENYLEGNKASSGTGIWKNVKSWSFCGMIKNGLKDCPQDVRASLQNSSSRVWDF